MLPTDWSKVFLAELARTGRVRVASDFAGIDHATAYRRRRTCPGFAAEWDAAFGRFIAAKRRAASQRWSEYRQQQTA